MGGRPDQGQIELCSARTPSGRYRRVAAGVSATATHGKITRRLEPATALQTLSVLANNMLFLSERALNSWTLEAQNGRTQAKGLARTVRCGNERARLQKLDSLVQELIRALEKANANGVNQYVRQSARIGMPLMKFCMADAPRIGVEEFA